MKIIPVLFLLVAAVLLCRAAPPLEPVTCNEDKISDAVRLAVQHINDKQEHGYKFNLTTFTSHKIEMLVGLCNIELQLELGETACHVVDTKNHEDCEFGGDAGWAVSAQCTVLMTVEGHVATVTKHSCSMQKEPATPEEMMMMCPDCPTLVNLNEEDGIKSINVAVTQFNQNNTNTHLYILKDVARIKSGYVMSMGMFLYSDFALVETNCPRESRRLPESCNPLCPDRARHAFCHLSYSRNQGLRRLECQYFPPKDTTPLGPGEQECVSAHQGSPGTSAFTNTCGGAVTGGDSTLHPICPYPIPVALPLPLPA